MHLKDIDYMPLENVRYSYFKVIPKLLKSGLSKVLVVVSIGLVTCGIIFNNPVVFTPGLLILIVIYGAADVVLAASYRNTIWQAFGQANQWPVENVGSIQELIPPSLVYGERRKAGLVLQGYVERVVFQLYNYTLRTDQKGVSLNRSFTIVLLRLPIDLPHIQLISKAVKGLRNDLQNSTRLQLEGNFNKYFKLCLERKQHIDVLSVLSPEVMEAMIDYDTHANIEIIDSRLFFIVPGDKRTEQETKKLITSVVKTGELIIRNIELSHYHTSIQGR